MKFHAGNDGRPKGVPLLQTVKRDVRRSAIRTLAPHAPQLLELAVTRALAGNEMALAACVSLLSAMVGETPKQQPGTSPVAD